MGQQYSFYAIEKIGPMSTPWAVVKKTVIEQTETKTLRCYESKESAQVLLTELLAEAANHE